MHGDKGSYTNFSLYKILTSYRGMYSEHIIVKEFIQRMITYQERMCRLRLHN